MHSKPVFLEATDGRTLQVLADQIRVLISGGDRPRGERAAPALPSLG